MRAETRQWTRSLERAIDYTLAVLFITRLYSVCVCVFFNWYFVISLAFSLSRSLSRPL